MSIINEISEKLQLGNAKDVKELVQQAIDEGFSAKDILEQGLLNGMGVIGVKFRNNEVFVPEVMVAARAMNMGMQILKPLLADADMKAKGKVVLGTVRGDLHDIGKNLVKMMMEGKGLEVIDIGVDAAPEKFIEAAQANGCNVIACSAMLTTTMVAMQEVVDASKSAGIRDQVSIMVGGAPVTQAFCDKIGADIYTEDASSAAEKAAACCQA